MSKKKEAAKNASFFTQNRKSKCWNETKKFARILQGYPLKTLKKGHF